MSGVPGGADVMEQMIKVTIDGAKRTLKLVAKVGAAGMKALALLAALLTSRSDKAVMGKTNAYNLVKDGHEISAGIIHIDDRKRFERIAKDLKIPFATIKSHDNPKDCNILFREVDRERINMALERLNIRIVDGQGAKKKNTSPSVEHSGPSVTVGRTTFERPKQSQQLRLVMNDPKRLNACLALQEHHSPPNVIYIAAQDPQATQVRLRKEWQRIGYIVLPGAQPIQIYLTGKAREYAKAPAYDIRHTTAPQKALPPPTDDYAAIKLNERMEKAIPVRYENIRDVRGYYNPVAQEIVLHNRLPVKEKFVLLAIGNAHAILHRLKGAAYDRQKDKPIAEAIAYAICKKHNVENSIDLAQVREWAKDKGETVIMEAMQQIEYGTNALHRELSGPQEVKTQAVLEQAPVIQAPAKGKER